MMNSGDRSAPRRHARAWWVQPCGALVLLVLSACAGEPVQVAPASCCSIGERALCMLGTPVASGAPCVCRTADAKGAFVVQGYACSPPQASAAAAPAVQLQAGSTR
jgi:hypothetical protein